MSTTWETIAREAAETLEFSSNPDINRKIKQAAKGLRKNVQDLFIKLPTDEDRELLADFILTCMNQENIATGTRRGYITSLVSSGLSKHFGFKKPFKEMAAKDIEGFLDSLNPYHHDDEQEEEEPDQHQSWINTRNTTWGVILKFFKWVAYPRMTPQQRKKLPYDKLPEVLKGLSFVPKKGPKSPIKEEDCWTDQDFAIAANYCEDKRLACYIAMARDTAARPGEILAVRLKEMKIEIDQDGAHYIQLHEIGRYGKKKQSRPVPPLKWSIKYYRDWKKIHPAAKNKPDSFLFISTERSARDKNIPISVESLRRDLHDLQDHYFPALLKRDDISQEDKDKIEHSLLRRKFHPYILRHSALNIIKRNPKIHEYRFRQLAGWSKTSKMIEVYTHDLPQQDSEDMMMAFGINIKRTDGDGNYYQQQLEQEMKGKICPYCKVENLQHTQFCVNCERVIDLEEFDKQKEKTAKEAEHARKELESMKKNIATTNRQVGELAQSLKNYIINKMDLNAIEDPKERAAEVERYFRLVTTNGNRNYISDTRPSTEAYINRKQGIIEAEVIELLPEEEEKKKDEQMHRYAEEGRKFLETIKNNDKDRSRKNKRR